MQVYRTGDISTQFAKILIYGIAGAGKTPIAATMAAWSPIVVSSEPGLASLRSANLPYVQARDYREALDVLKWLSGSKEASQFGCVYFDSISALSENILAAHKKKVNDARKFSPATTADTLEIVLSYLSIAGKHIIMTCKGTEIVDQITGVKTVEPFAVVPKLGPALPYYFDCVFNLSRIRDPATNTESVFFRCRENDYARYCRNRLGNLDLYEPPDLAYMINKMNAVT